MNATPRGHSSDDPGPWIRELLGSTFEASWALHEVNYHPALEHEVESQLAISNGLLGTRASLDVATGASHSATFVAGLYDRSPHYRELPALVSIPDWPRIRILVAGDELSIEEGGTIAHSRTLDMRRGLLLSDWTQRTPGGHEVRVRSLRFVSQRSRHHGVQLVRIETAQAVPLELTTSLEPGSDALVLVRGDFDCSTWRTAHGEQGIAVAQAASLWLEGTVLPAASNGGKIRRWRWQARPRQQADFVRHMTPFSGGSDVEDEASARRELARARRGGPRALVDAHTRAWARRWDASDVAVDGDPQSQDALRFAAYHLNSAANPQSSQSSIGARALTGEGYLGHVFWDTEIFLLPFYTLTWPAAARSLLQYRHRTLNAAREKAARLGYRGALYAWESADTGEDVTPTLAVGPAGEVIPIRNGALEHHVSADVAYAVWQYWHVTRDFAFLQQAGAEILLETARFWASRASFGADGFFHIRGVIGPDEYHEDVDDNAYTNHMARWNLQRGLEVGAFLGSRSPARWKELRSTIHLDEDELRQWQTVSQGLVTGLDSERGLFEQFQGFFGLERVDLSSYAKGVAPIDVLLGRERTQRSQVVKQPDVLMLIALLNAEIPRWVQDRNFDYYEPLAAHGSSLSPVMHGLVAARLGRIELARRYFEQAAAIDLDNTMGNAAAGVHIGALGGLWQLAVLGFGGVDISGDQLRIAPRLPGAWQSLEFPLRWRGRRLRVRVAEETVAATLERGKPLTFRLGAEKRRLRPSETWMAPLRTREEEGYAG